MEKYYVISSENVGPNAKPLNENVVISTQPGETNMSHEPRVSGWLGTTNDNSRHAHGEYDTVQNAEKYISENWPRYQKYDDDYRDDCTIASYRDCRDVIDVDSFLFEYRSSVIDENTTDEQIAKLAEDIIAEEPNTYIDGNIEEYLREYRDELRVE